jgi:hypothetical protein
MNTDEAIALAGSRRELAKLLGITTQATYLWKGTVPELRVYQLRDRMGASQSLPRVSTTDSSPSAVPPGD